MIAKKHSKKVSPAPPLVIVGCRVLYYSFMPPSVSYSGNSLVIVGGREIGPVPRLIIAEPLRAEGFDIIHCDKNWNVLAGGGGGYSSVSEAKRRAERMYPGITKTWVKSSISKTQALAIEKKMWRGEECSFCNRIPPDFQRSLHSKKARICNICVEEIYWDFVEMQEESFAPPQGEYYADNGFEHIAPYISRLLVPADGYKALRIFALDRMRGCGVLAHGSVVQISFVMEGSRESPREVNIRSFFASRGNRPSGDYLASKGRTRILQYPLSGTAEELTASIKTILQELCDISPKEALSIKLDERKDSA